MKWVDVISSLISVGAAIFIYWRLFTLIKAQNKHIEQLEKIIARYESVFDKLLEFQGVRIGALEKVFNEMRKAFHEWMGTVRKNN